MSCGFVAFRAEGIDRAVDRAVLALVEKIEGGRDAEDLFACKDLEHFWDVVKRLVHLSPSNVVKLVAE